MFLKCSPFFFENQKNYIWAYKPFYRFPFFINVVTDLRLALNGAAS